MEMNTDSNSSSFPVLAYYFKQELKSQNQQEYLDFYTKQIWER